VCLLFVRNEILCAVCVTYSLCLHITMVCVLYKEIIFKSAGHTVFYFLECVVGGGACVD
jgi:hypothetical protein